MLKLHLISDIHLEFREISDKLEKPYPDAVILAGDIGLHEEGVAWAAHNYPSTVPVFYIPGNHEYYKADIETCLLAMRKAASSTPNIRILDRDEIILESLGRRYRILGATLWTDYLFNGPHLREQAMLVAGARLNDHRMIRFRGRPFSPADALEFHRRDLGWLVDRLSDGFDGTTIVATHHAPSRLSMHPRYPDGDLNCCFLSDLDQTIMKFAPALWLHGHTHWPVDGFHGRTRIVSRQVGYPGEGVPPGTKGYLLVE